jgi:hypothetical protein
LLPRIFAPINGIDNPGQVVGCGNLAVAPAGVYLTGSEGLANDATAAITWKFTWASPPF